MVSSDVIVATCHDSVSSHLMSLCMQLWHNGQVACTAKKCRTCINALHVILLSIRHWSVKPCLGNVRTKQRSPAQFHDQHHNINRFRQHCVLWSTASPECSPGSAESDQRCNKPHKEKWADTDRQILIIFKITDWNWIKLSRNNCNMFSILGIWVLNNVTVFAQNLDSVMTTLWEKCVEG